MPDQRPTRQMIDMEVLETSGVDHPAHGFEGWLVKKSAGPGRLTRLESILRGKIMPITKEDLLKEIAESKVSESVKEFVTKSLDLTDDINAAAELWSSLRTKQEAQDPNVPTVDETPDMEAAAGAVLPAPAPAPVAAAAGDVFKSLDKETQEALAKATGESPELAKAFEGILGVAQKAVADAAAERDARLDDEAIAKSKEMFKNVGIDHEQVAPALRKMAEIDPDTYAVVKAALEAADGQLEAAGMFKELGHSQRAAGAGSAMAKAEAVAKSLVDAGTVKSIPEGVAKAFADDPSLYEQHEKEGSR